MCAGVFVAQNISAAGADTVVVLTRSLGENTPVGMPDFARARSGKGLGYEPLAVNISRTPHGRWDAVVRGFMFGFVDGVDAPVNIDMGRSFEIGMLHLPGVRYTLPKGYTSVSAGLGLFWRNYRISGTDVCFVPDGHGHIEIGQYPADTDPGYSRIRVFSLSLPVVFEQRLPLRVPGKDRLGLSAGVILNYNAHAGVKTEWRDAASNTVEQYCGSVGHRRFTVDFLAMVRFCRFAGLYVKYSPQTVLTGSVSPRFRSFSTGISIFL